MTQTSPPGDPSFPHPLGVSIVAGGVNVALYSSVAEGVCFCTFDANGAERRHPITLADSDIWHGFIPGVEAGQQYGFRVSGPYAPSAGARCNPAKLLLDPYGRSVTGNLAWKASWSGGGADAPDPTDSALDAPRSVVVQSSFNWDGDAPLGRALADSVIYELHVKGLTAGHPDVPAADQGTYAGLAHPKVIAYLQGLGITAVELLPVHQSLTNGVLAGEKLTNYWGYDTIGFFALHSEHSAARRAGGPPGSEVDEFKDMVKALHDVLQDPTLVGSKLIAEPWTAAGNEQGQFPPRWSEWNGQYRDTMRDYWRDQVSSPRWVGARLAGSPDMYASGAPRYSLRRQPTATIDFVTCHDGFTLNDLVSYDSKHKDANQQNNQDGTDDNRSWNCGSGPGDDGSSADPDVAALRRRQQRNLLATLLVSRGVPMLLAGDERNRTQQGNNNAYCQDNPISWMDWTADPAAENLISVVRKLISLRIRVNALRAARFPEPGPAQPSEPAADTGLSWLHPNGSPVSGRDWDNVESHSFAVVFADAPPALTVLVMLNGYCDPVAFTVPSPPTGGWSQLIDTMQEDGAPASGARLGPGASIIVGPRSVAIAAG